MSADEWIDRPRNVVLLMVVAVFVGAGLAAIDTLTLSDVDNPLMFSFCSLPYPADNSPSTPLTGVKCWVDR